MKKAGFTLIEILVAMTIAAVIVAGSMAMIGRYQEKAKAGFTTTSIQNIKSALVLYSLEEGSAPSTDEGLDVLVKDGFLKEIPKDGWGRKFKYNAGPDIKNKEKFSEYEIISFGKDGRESADDKVDGQ